MIMAMPNRGACSSALVVVSMAIGLGTLLPDRTVAAPVFLGLGDLPGGANVSVAWGVSADGTTVVGTSESAAGTEAFRWTVAEGMIGLADLPGGAFVSYASDVSADGSVVVGQSQSAPVPASEAFRWTTPTGLAGIGDLEGGSFFSTAVAVSYNGHVIAGTGNTANGSAAYRWTAQTGMAALDNPFGVAATSTAYDMSADGSTIVGVVEPGVSAPQAFRWTPTEGMIGLGALPGGSGVSSARAVSGDGLSIFGVSDSAQGLRAFRWTDADGLEMLGEIDPAAASSDGSLVVGTDFALERALIWDEIHGVRDLQSVLQGGFGVDIDGWQLLSARGMSASGTVIVGAGINPAGRLEAWMAVIPEPQSGILALCAFVYFLGKRLAVHRQRRRPVRNGGRAGGDGGA